MIHLLKLYLGITGEHAQQMSAEVDLLIKVKYMTRAFGQDDVEQL
jgi:hypothetical protein